MQAAQRARGQQRLSSSAAPRQRAGGRRGEELRGSCFVLRLLLLRRGRGDTEAV